LGFSVSAFQPFSFLPSDSYLANSPLVSQIAYAQGSTTRMTTSKQYDYGSSTFVVGN